MTTTINTGFDKLYKVVNDKIDMLPSDSNSSVICDIDEKFDEFGVYQLTIERTTCTLEILKEPVNIYLRKY